MDVVEVAVGGPQTCARLRDGRVFCWGACNTLGASETCAIGGGHQPAPLPGFSGSATQLSLPHLGGLTSSFFGYLVASDARLHRWGTGENAQPAAAVTFPIVSVAAGLDHTCVLAADRTVWCFGDNSFGQLGDGTTTARGTAVQALGLTEVVDIDVGTNHSCAVRMDGTLYCWGLGDFGRLGVDPTTLRCGVGGMVECADEPIQVPGLTDVVQVAAGGAHTCIRRAGGSVSCWGFNVGEVLGGPGPDTFVPQPVSAITDAVDLDTTSGYACAVRADTSVWCWGDMPAQLGRTDGTIAPGPVERVTGATSVVTSSTHACAVAQGGAWCWGSNRWYELGLGFSSDALLPELARFPRP